jgi:hypothetical protein
MRAIRGFIIALLFMVAGGAGPAQQVHAQEAYPYHREYSHLAFDWKVSRGADMVLVEGVVHNINYERLRDLVLTVSVLDPKGEKLGEGTYLFRAVLIDIGDSVPFELKIPVNAGRQPSTLLFVSRYRPDDREAPEKLDSQSFEAPLP